MTDIRQAITALEASPVVAALKSAQDAHVAAQSQVAVAFVLGGSILTMDHIMEALRGKLVFLHMDLIEGVGRDAAGLEYAARHWQPAGIITTRAPLVRRARELGLLAVQRVFLLDSASIKSGTQLISQCQPDMVEVMPGVIP